MQRLIIISALLVLTGCSKLTVENYAKVETGMSLKEISGILGEPTRCDDMGGIQSCRWSTEGEKKSGEKTNDEATSISVQFIADRAVMHSGTNLH